MQKGRCNFVKWILQKENTLCKGQKENKKALYMINMQGGFLIGKIFVLKKDRMKWVDSAGVGIVEMLYNLLISTSCTGYVCLCGGLYPSGNIFHNKTRSVYNLLYQDKTIFTI